MRRGQGGGERRCTIIGREGGVARVQIMRRMTRHRQRASSPRSSSRVLDVVGRDDVVHVNGKPPDPREDLRLRVSPYRKSLFRLRLPPHPLLGPSSRSLRALCNLNAFSRNARGILIYERYIHSLYLCQIIYYHYIIRLHYRVNFFFECRIIYYTTTDKTRSYRTQKCDK